MNNQVIRQIFIVFPHYEHTLHAEKDPGIIYSYLAKDYPVTMVSNYNNPQINCLTLGNQEIIAGNWLPGNNATIIFFHGGKWFVPLYKKIKNKGLRLLLKADTDGHELLRVINPWNGQCNAQMRSTKIAIGKFFKHFLKWLNIDKWAERRGLNYFDAIMLESQRAMKLFLKNFPLWASKFYYVPDGVQFGHYSNCSKKKQLIAVGRWDDEQKNFPGLLVAVQRVLEKNPDYCCKILGNMPANWQEEVISWPLSVRQRLLAIGKVNPQQIHAYYNDSQVCISSSWWESFGLATMEAISCGCSIACTPTPVAEQCLDGICGTVAKGWTDVALATAIDSEITLWRSGSRQASAIVDYAKRFYSWTVIMPKIVALIEGAVSNEGKN